MTVCIQVQVNDPVVEIRHPHRTGIIKQIVMAPNGINDLSLIALLYVKFDGGGEIISTSDKFKIVDGYPYAKFYPSTILGTDSSTE